VVPLIPTTATATIVPLLVSSGVLLLVIHQVRSFGIKAEERIMKKYDGMPTTRRLRLRNATNPTLLARRRNKLEEVYGQSLPNADMEQSDPVAADEIYADATRRLITKARQNQDNFPLVQEEVINYGFRRNFRGVKWYAILLTVACMLADGLLGYFTGASTRIVATAGFHVIYLFTVLLVVKDSWVLEVGERYADRLFEALDAMEDLPSHSA
ncbi:MAG: hypothetical protein LC775_02575, partial [Acidobacteria bacterium]|nr:hypothetical protein [Acidobacteriota bacterium]